MTEPINIRLDPDDVTTRFAWERFRFHLDTNVGTTVYKLTVGGELEEPCDPEGERWKIVMFLPNRETLTRTIDVPSFREAIKFIQQYAADVLVRYAAAEEARLHFNGAVRGWATQRYEPFPNIHLSDDLGSLVAPVGHNMRDFVVTPPTATDVDTDEETPADE